MNTIFEKSSEKKSNVDEKILKPGGKIGESYNIKCHNCSHEKPLWEKKSRSIHYIYVDIDSLKPIVRKLLKQNSHRKKSIM
jgi:hypothetical protein